MDPVMALVIAFGGTAVLVGIIMGIHRVFEPGGLAHGDWLEKTNPHHCNTPYGIEGEVGNTWRCRKCRQIWIKHQFNWERMN
jgi:hypothetical protein